MGGKHAARPRDFRKRGSPSSSIPGRRTNKQIQIRRKVAVVGGRDPPLQQIDLPKTSMEKEAILFHLLPPPACFSFYRACLLFRSQKTNRENFLPNWSLMRKSNSFCVPRSATGGGAPLLNIRFPTADRLWGVGRRRRRGTHVSGGGQKT